MATSDAPISIGRVTLVVNDLNNMTSFYSRILGLNVLSSDGEASVLGAAERPLLELRKDTAAQFHPNEAGLFHTAFLMPNRAKLGSWYDHAVSAGVRLQGASDHSVSEAIYLQDPEGNGIEVYADRLRSQWNVRDGKTQISTRVLDVKDLSKASSGRWKSAPNGLVIGHVHLQVGDIGLADDFMIQSLKMDKVQDMPTAGFYSSGGYHHHFAGNIWNSANAGMRSKNTTGLAEVEVVADPAILAAGYHNDPWGTSFKVTAV